MFSIAAEGLRLFARRGILAAVGVCLIGGPIAWSRPVWGQAKQEQLGPSPQIALTAKHIESFIANSKAMRPFIEKFNKKQDAQTGEQAEAAAKKYGFSSLDEYDLVNGSILAVWAGIDPKTKQYSDPVPDLKKELLAIQADKKLKPAARKKQIGEINDLLAQVQVEHPGNIPLVVKYYDQLEATLEQPKDEPQPKKSKGKK